MRLKGVTRFCLGISWFRTRNVVYFQTERKVLQSRASFLNTARINHACIRNVNVPEGVKRRNGPEA
jgi:hypothetical protein